MLTYKHFKVNTEEEGDALFLALQLALGKEFRDVKINYRPDGGIVYHLAIDENVNLTRVVEVLKAKLNTKGTKK